MLTISDPPQETEKVSVDPLAATVSESAWYQGCEMGMVYCRLTEQLAAQPGTKIAKELRCLERVLELDLARFCAEDGVQLIDLGTGDGQKMVIVVRALNAAGIRTIRYVPVDKNPYISLYASLNLVGLGKKMWSRQEAERVFGPWRDLDGDQAPRPETFSIESLVRRFRVQPTRSELLVRHGVTVPLKGLPIDFFEDLPGVVKAANSFSGARTNIFCLLGNTFGNYPQEKREKFIDTLYNEMDAGDLFLLGVSLRPKRAPRSFVEAWPLQNEYLPGEAFMRLAADHPKSKYRLRYHSELHSMLYWFERPDTSTQDMGYSYLFDPEELVRDLKAARMEVVACQSYPDFSSGDTLPRSECEPQYMTILSRKAW